MTVAALIRFLRPLDRRLVMPLVRTLARAEASGIGWRLTSGYRTIKKQAQLYALYVAGKSRFPAAPPGKSKHNFGLAFDVVVSDLDAFVEIARSEGLRWGGERDPVHFEI